MRLIVHTEHARYDFDLDDSVVTRTAIGGLDDRAKGDLLLSLPAILPSGGMTYRVKGDKVREIAATTTGERW
jgi:hypothetical protein